MKWKHASTLVQNFKLCVVWVITCIIVLTTGFIRDTILLVLYIPCAICDLLTRRRNL